jgi:hypothetical protein
MTPTRPQYGFLLKLQKLGGVRPAFAGYGNSTVRACERRRWCILSNGSWRITYEGLRYLK